MHPTHFEDAAARTRLSDRGKAAARAVLVDGQRQADVARAFGLDKAAMSRCVQSIMRAHGETDRYPPTWETVTLTVPKRIAQEFRTIARRARVEHGIRAKKRPPKR